MTATHVHSRLVSPARPRRARIRAAIGASLLLLIGCESRMAPPEKDGPPYQGPPIRLDDSGPTLTVVFTAPTPGWQVHLNRIEEGFQTRDVLITIVATGERVHRIAAL